MRILALQNLYPPQGPGGCGVAAQSVIDQLRQRGHAVLVLTSTYGCAHPWEDDHIWRVLAPYRWGFVSPQYGLVRREAHNQRELRNAIEQHVPDIAVVWSWSGLSLSLVLQLQKLQIPVVYYLHDHWLLHWQQDPWQLLWRPRMRKGWRAAAGRLLATPALRSLAAAMAPFDAAPAMKHCLFISKARKQEYLNAGFPVGESPVIGNGIDKTVFKPGNRPARPGLKLLFVGSIVPGKGIHVAIEALSRVQASHNSVELTVTGPALDPEYLSELQRLVHRLNLGSVVTFLDAVPHDEVAALYQGHDLFLLPSLVPEGLPLVLLEAMACGLPVIATNNGGQVEVVEYGLTGFLCSPEDSEQMAHYIDRLNNPDLRGAMGVQARQAVSNRYGWDAVAGQLEAYLAAIAADRPAPLLTESVTRSRFIQA